MIGDIHVSLDNDSDAIEAYNKAHELDENNLEVLTKLSQIYEKQEQWQMAMDTYLQLLEKQPENTELNSMIGRLACKAEQFDKAIEHYQIAHRREPDNLNYAMSLAEVYGLVKHFEQSKRIYEDLVQNFPNNVNIRIRLGEAYKSLDMEFEAITQFREAFKLSPSNIEVLSVLGTDYLKKGILDKALEHFEAILQQVPDHIETLMNVGLINLEKNLFEQAIGSFSRILENEPKNKDGLEHLEQIYEKQENYSEQIHILIKLEEIDPLNLNYLLKIANCYFKLLNYGKTEEYALKLLEIESNHQEALNLACDVYMRQQNYPSAIELLELNLKMNPEAIKLYLDLFNACFQQNETEKAGRYIVQALSMEKENIDVLQTALFYYKEIGNLNKQTEVCNTLLSLNPDDHDFKRQMVQLLMEQQMYKEAMNLLTDLLVHTPNDPGLLVSQAKIQTLQGLPSKAVITLQQVLAIDENNSMAHFELGRTYHTQKEWNKAIIEFKKAVNLGIDDPKAYIELGEIYSAKGFFDTALEVYQKAIALDRENIQINMEIAEIYFKLNMPEKALEEYESLQEKQPSNIKMNTRLAQVYQTNRMFSQSLELLNRLLEEQPQNTTILYEIGRTYLYMDNREESREYFTQVLNLEPGHTMAQVEMSVLDAHLNPQKTIQTLRKMIDQSPIKDTFIYLSRVFIENNMIDDAVAEFKVLAKRYPDSAPTWAELGKLYTVLSKTYQDPKIRQNGVEALEKAIQLDENYPPAYFYLGESFHLSGELEIALAKLRLAYQLDPQNLEIREYLTAVETQKTTIEVAAKLEEAKTYLSRGMDQNAIIEYEAILELDPFNCDANFDLASIYIKQENLELSKKYLQNSVERNPEFVKGFQDLAKINKQEGNLYEAEINLHKILDLNTNDFDSNLLMGEVLTESEEISEAAIYLQKAIEINPTSPKPYFQLGKMFLKIGETQQAKEFYEKCYKLDSSITEVNEFFVQLDQKETAEKLERLLNQAREAEETQELEQAKSYYEDILSLQPGHFFARYKSGELNEKLGRMNEAAFDFQQAYNNYSEHADEFPKLPIKLGLILAHLQKVSEAIPVLEEAIKIEPSNQELYLLLIQQYKEFFLTTGQEDFEGTTPMSLLKRIKDYSVSNPLSIVSWLGLGYAHRINLLGELELEESTQEGIKAYQKALEIDSTNEHLLYNLGLLNHFAGKIAKSKEYLKNLIQLNPEHIRSFQKLTQIYIEGKEYDEAAQTLRKLIDLEPENGIHRIELIDLYKLACETDDNKDQLFSNYLDEFASAVKANDQSVMAHFDYGYAILTLNSNFSLSEEELSLSISEFKRAISVAPNNPWGYWGLKRVYNKESISGRHRYQEAIDICKKALEFNETSQAYCELGNALNEDYETNRKTEALENYKKALFLEPDFIEVYFKIASIYRIRNNYDEAMQFYRRVIELDPTTSFAKDAKRSLVHIEKSKADLA